MKKTSYQFSLTLRQNFETANNVSFMLPDCFCGKSKEIKFGKETICYVNFWDRLILDLLELVNII